MKWQRAWAPIRDVLFFALGAFVILYQQLTGFVNLELLLTATALLGIPGSISVLHLLRGSPETPVTPESSSSPPSSPSSPSPPSSLSSTQ